MGPRKFSFKKIKIKIQVAALKKHSHFLLRNEQTDGQFKGPHTPGPCEV